MALHLDNASLWILSNDLPTNLKIKGKSHDFLLIFNRKPIFFRRYASVPKVTGTGYVRILLHPNNRLKLFCVYVVEIS